MHTGAFGADIGQVTSRVLNEDGEIVLHAKHGHAQLGRAPQQSPHGWTCTPHRGHVAAWQYAVGYYTTITILTGALLVAPLVALAMLLFYCCHTFRRRSASWVLQHVKAS